MAESEEIYFKIEKNIDNEKLIALRVQESYMYPDAQHEKDMGVSLEQKTAQVTPENTKVAPQGIDDSDSFSELKLKILRNVDTEKLTKRKGQEYYNYPDDQQEKDKKKSLNQRTVQVNPENTIEAPQDTDSSASFSESKYLKRIVSKCQKAKTNAKGIVINNMKFLGKKDQEQNKIHFRNKTPKLFSKTKKYVIQSEEDFQILKKKRKIQTEHTDFRMPRRFGGKNSKPEAGVLTKVRKITPPSTSLNFNYMLKVCKERHILNPSMPIESSNILSNEEVRAYFNHYLKSNEESADEIMPRAISNEDMEVSSGPSNQNFTYPFKTSTESEAHGLENRKQKLSKVPFSRKAKIRVPITRRKKIKSTAKKTNYIEKQNEKESLRKWILEQIKDKEVVLKFKIIEGTYSEDEETKLRCIKKAKYIQSLIDKLSNTLDEHDKLENTEIKTTGFWRGFQEDTQISPTETTENLSRSPLQSNDVPLGSATKNVWDLLKLQAKDKKDTEYPETYPKTLRDLLEDLFRNKDSETFEYILEILNPKVLFYEYHEYLEGKKRRDTEGEKVKNTAISAVEDFYTSVEDSRSRVKSKIPRPEIRTLIDYKNYIYDLKEALYENIECLEKLISLKSSLISPLMSYVSLSHTKFVGIENFLDVEREYLTPETR